MLMKKNQIWFLLMIIAAVGALTFSCKTFFDLYQFISLKKSILSSSFEPQIIKEKKGHYALNVRYHYEVGSSSYLRTQRIYKYTFKNRWAAQDAFKKLESSQQRVWYSEAHPEKGVLNKALPIKKIASTTLLFGILVYFYLLGKYMFKMEK